jgi:hypothetical protein
MWGSLRKNSSTTLRPQKQYLIPGLEFGDALVQCRPVDIYVLKSMTRTLPLKHWSIDPGVAFPIYHHGF